jgi:transposase
MMIQIPREEILAVYAAGPEAVVAMVEGLVAQFNTRIAHLEGEVAQLRDEVARLKRNSRNSSKPPSSDGYQKPSPKSLRKRKGKKSGGQKGHPGNTLQAVKKPDEFVKHRVKTCEKCKASLRDAPVRDIDKRQVFDIPPVKIEVTEHQVEIKDCPCCGHRTHGKFPEDVRQPTQYGSRFKSILVYLNHYQLLPLDRIRELCEDLFHHSISEGTIFNASAFCYRRLAAFEEKVKAQLIESPVAHFDETGIRINGKTKWLHVASTSLLTAFEAFDKRGQEAMEAMDILPHFMGRAIHDHLKAYFKYTCDHGLCNAHHLRELIFIVDHYKQPWAKKMKKHLLDIKKTVDKRKRKAKSIRA